MQWYAHYPGDYGRDTAHLSMIEDGAYRRLLDHYYSTGAPLPSDRERLYRVCRAFTPPEQQAVETVLTQFFTVVMGAYHNARADRELHKRAENRTALAESGRRGAQKRWRPTSSGDGRANGHPNGQANGVSIARPQPQPENSKPKDTHTMGVCERLVQAWNENRGLLPAVRELTTDRRNCLLARIREDPEFPNKLVAAAAKAASTPFLRGEGSRGWVADFDWMIAKNTNVVRVLEGNYDSGGSHGVNQGTGRPNGALPVPAEKRDIRRPLSIPA